MLWKDLIKQFIGGNPPTSQSLHGSALRNGLKLLHVIVQDWSAFTRNFTFSYCHTRYWKQRFTYFCNPQICNTGSFFSINKWQRKYFLSLVWFGSLCLLSGHIYSYLCRNIANSKGFTNFQAALYMNNITLVAVQYGCNHSVPIYSHIARLRVWCCIYTTVWRQECVNR